MEPDVNIHVTAPRYQQIATDIASRIVEGNYKVGEKVYARSSLASQYGVSSETARRAICVLSDLEIVSSTKGSGVTIRSYENAVRFVKQYRDVSTINEIKARMLESVDRQKKEMEHLNTYLNEMISKAEHFRSTNPFVPFQIDITENTPYINKTISEISFWQNTAATIVAIKRKDEVLISPGPYATLVNGDTLCFVGEDYTEERVLNFLYPQK